MWSIIFAVVITLFILLCMLIILYIKKKNMHIWLWSYVKRNLKQDKKVDEPIDILFLFVDHFELNNHEDRLDAWENRYPQLAKKHKDYDGEYPKHTFYYAMDLMQEHELSALQGLVKDRLGEFELHWHHSHDTEETFLQKIKEAMTVFHKYGYMLPYEDGQTACFSFIHGNWSLGNSRGAEFCGVDNEISLLQELGCYGDFTFPALFSVAQPSCVNAIYYCKDDESKKSYDTGRPSKVGVSAQSDEFMIFQGALSINFKDWRHKWHPTIEDGDIYYSNTHGDPKRIDAWVRQAIHVEGNKNWQFVKVFCHGAQDHKYVVGPQTDKMFSYLESNYNDGKKYRLHYVTAREAYNIVKAAEDGKVGNPNAFRDYKIPHPLDREAVN